MTTVLEAPVIDQKSHHQEAVSKFEQERINASFDEIVRDLELTPEALKDEASLAVLDLVADCWAATDDMPRAQAIKERDWLTEVTLRAVGNESGFVKANGLTEYQESNVQAEVFGPIFARYQDSDMSQELTASISAIAAEFGFAEKFVEGTAGLEKVQCMVMPRDAPVDIKKTLKAAGTFVKLPNGQGIIVDEFTFHSGVEQNNSTSRGLIAHELGHARRSLAIGKGDFPLAFIFDELYAEWVGGNKGMYYNEKHMANILTLTGLDIRGEILPKLAHGEMSIGGLIGALKDQFGSKNALRLLAHIPIYYPHSGAEQPSAILEDCMKYVIQNAGLTPDNLRDRIFGRFQPHIAGMMLSHRDIRAVIPDSIYPQMLERARQDLQFDETKVS